MKDVAAILYSVWGRGQAAETLRNVGGDSQPQPDVPEQKYQDYVAMVGCYTDAMAIRPVRW